MNKILLVSLIIPAISPVSAFASGFGVIDNTSVETDSVSFGTNGNASYGVSTGDTNIENLDNTNTSQNSTDAWLKNAIQNMDFGGFDMSAFSFISTGDNSNVVSMYTDAAKDMANNGWGKIPTDGVFSSANGFKGYSLTMADGPSTAMELFQSTFSGIYDAMKDGSLMGDLGEYDKSKSVSDNTNIENMRKNAEQSMKTLGDMTEMTNMINSFTGTLNTELSKFSNNDLFKSAKNGLNSIDIQSEIDRVKI